FLERDVALQQTPWPRQAHLDLVDFPESGELTVGRDAPPPRVAARAYRWVIADSNDPTGWRPLRWDDLNQELVGRAVPKLPKCDALREDPMTVDTLERLAYESDEIVVPEAQKVRDEIKQAMNNRIDEDPSDPAKKTTRVTQDYEEMQEVFKALL